MSLKFLGITVPKNLNADVAVAGFQRNGDEFELISGRSLRACNNARREFNDRVRGKTRRKSPWADVASDFFNSLFAVDIDEVDGELHKKSVHGFTRNDPEARSRRKTGASQQSSVAGGPMVGNFGIVGKLSSAGKIRDPDQGVRFRSAFRIQVH